MDTKTRRSSWKFHPRNHPNRRGTRKDEEAQDSPQRGEGRAAGEGDAPRLLCSLRTVHGDPEAQSAWGALCPTTLSTVIEPPAHDDSLAGLSHGAGVIEATLPWALEHTVTGPVLFELQWLELCVPCSWLPQKISQVPKQALWILMMGNISMHDKVSPCIISLPLCHRMSSSFPLQSWGDHCPALLSCAGSGIRAELSSGRFRGCC